MLFALPLQYENQPIAKITIEADNLPEGSTIDSVGIKTRIKTREGDVFSQIDFDNDLKMLVGEFDRVEPSITSVDGYLYITLRLWTRSTIRTINWYGNSNIEHLKAPKRTWNIHLRSI